MPIDKWVKKGLKLKNLHFWILNHWDSSFAFDWHYGHCHGLYSHLIFGVVICRGLFLAVFLSGAFGRSGIEIVTCSCLSVYFSYLLAFLLWSRWYFLRCLSSWAHWSPGASWSQRGATSLGGFLFQVLVIYCLICYWPMVVRCLLLFLRRCNWPFRFQ